MADIGYRLSDPIKQYVTGEIGKTEFKKEVKNVERTTDGANWWTISTAVLDETHESYYVEVVEPLSELYEYEDLERIFGTDIMDQIE
jgi:hypothetical protein